MEDIQNADEQIANTDERQVGVLDVPQGIPGDHENSEGDGDAEEFGNDME